MYEYCWARPNSEAMPEPVPPPALKIEKYRRDWLALMPQLSIRYEWIIFQSGLENRCVSLFRMILARYCPRIGALPAPRSEEHTSELQSLMRISYAVFCLKKKKTHI